MSDRKIPVITISREYGAFGRTIAEKVAASLSLPLYGRDEIIKRVAKESGYAEEDIRKESEQMSRGARWMNTFLNNAAVYSSSYDEIFKAQREVILELAQTPCIILGRCGDIF